MVSAILIALIVPLAWMLKAPMYVHPNAAATPNKVSLNFKQILVVVKNHKPFWFLAMGFLFVVFR